jgi:hypothetical protein
VRRLLLLSLVLAGSILTGLLAASFMLRQECPLCSGTTRYLEENPSQCADPPAVSVDCPRCDDHGRVTLFNSRMSGRPEPLIAAIMRHSNRPSWDGGDVNPLLSARLSASGLRTATSQSWSDVRDVRGMARFVRRGRKTYAILILRRSLWTTPDEAPVRVLLLGESGEILDAVRVTAWGGASMPKPTFVVPEREDGPSVRIRLLTWANKPLERIEIDHAGRLWKETAGEIREKLGIREWDLYLDGGRLRLFETASGKSVAD